jgi:hypothetical protein
VPRARSCPARDAGWRNEYEARAEAAFTEKQPSSREEALEVGIVELERFCGKLVLENEILKRVRETPLERRHAMIVEATEGHPDISERDLCRLFSVSRPWYYERPSPEQRTYSREYVELRNAIQRIVLEFLGVMATAESRRNC